MSPSEEPQAILQEETPITVPARAAWSPTAIVWICFLFSILPAGILYALNFARLGQPQKTKNALLIVGVMSTIFYGLFLLSAFKPETLSSANEGILRILSLLMTMSVAWYFYLSQQSLFARHIRQGGKKASLWPPVLWSLATIVIVGIALVGYFTWQVTQDEHEFDRAVTLLQNGKYGEAEKIFKAYRTEYPDETPAYMNLAIIYSNEGRLLEAKQELESLLRMNPKHKNATQLLKDVEDDLKAEKQ